MVNRFLVLLLILSFFCLSGCGRLLQPRSAAEIQDSSADVDGKYLGYLDNQPISKPKSILQLLSELRSESVGGYEAAVIQIRRVDEASVEISIEKEGKTRSERCSFEIIENEMQMTHRFCVPYFPIAYAYVRTDVGLSKNTKGQLVVRSDSNGCAGILLFSAGTRRPWHPPSVSVLLSEVPK